MASRILPPFSHASRWPSDGIVQHRICASLRPAESVELLCRASARLGVCSRSARKHHHGSQDDYFSIQIVHSAASFSLPQSGGKLFRPQEFFTIIAHCTPTAASIQRIIRSKHRSGRQHIPHHHRFHRESRQPVID